jgi:DM9 repeat
LLPINDQTMEWVLTSHGEIPSGQRPVEGGYEENGARLFHAIVCIDNVWVPGKTGEHLVRDHYCEYFLALTRLAKQRGANFPYGGERVVHENYQILCWRS